MHIAALLCSVWTPAETILKPKEIPQVMNSIPWVRCASGNVFSVRGKMSPSSIHLSCTSPPSLPAPDLSWKLQVRVRCLSPATSRFREFSLLPEGSRLQVEILFVCTSSLQHFQYRATNHPRILSDPTYYTSLERGGHQQ